MSKLKTVLNNLKAIKKDALKIREKHLGYCVDEVEVDSIIVHVSYLRNLLCIERQLDMHKTICKYTSN